MRWKPLAWILISLLCFVAAWYAWQWGEKRGHQDVVRPEEAASPAGPTSDGGTGAFQLASQPGTVTNAVTQPNFPDEDFPHRLRNTPATLHELMRSDTALLLENALVDTAQRGAPAVPDHLRAKGDPGAYIVQARGAVTREFRQLIAEAGGTIVSYVPNNAYLIRGSSESVSALETSPLTQSVLPFEPYYKLKGDLLATAVDRKALPEESVLTVVLFPDAGSEAREALSRLGGVILAEDRSPFGPILKVQVPPDALSTVAGLTGVQMVDRTYLRAAATDLTRPRLGVADSSTNTVNTLELTGEGVVVQVVDSGVDENHPDLSGRVFADPVLDPLSLSLTDVDGHGTHVAGIIIGDGSESDTVTNTSVGGSVIPAVTGQFRGMAHEAEIVAIGAIGGDVHTSDAKLQEAASRNEALISNNSWRQLGNFAYDIVAAGYDAAVRDAIPQTNGSQPVLFVFAAGNEGFGDDNGSGGIPDTIGSPATAKNVITVGAIEQLRELTNAVIICEGNSTNNCVTNPPPFDPNTDSDDQVAFFSSRGNVGIGVEGDFGRLKPDVVAPGEFVISTRSTDWDTNAYYHPTNYQTFNTIPLVKPIFPGEVRQEPPQLFEPDVIEVRISVTNAPGESGPLPEVGLPIYVRNDNITPELSDPPEGTNTYTFSPLVAGTNLLTWYFWVGNPTEDLIFVTITYRIATTNSTPISTRALQDANAGLAPWYRYERGTSMAAPAISGTLALVQEYYVKRFGTNPSPALLKALLINGCRSVEDYFYGNVTEVNDQGWGLFSLPRILPAISNSAPGSASAIHFYEQSVSNSLVTAREHTRFVTVDPSALDQPLRFTLVWTDPPGNPVVGSKLVNNLDLVVTNLDDPSNPIVYFGNRFPSSSDYTEPWYPHDTNLLTIPDLDTVNNVENVYLPGFPGTNFSVTVVGRRVNVNALPTHPDDTAQDYALVISSGNGTVSNALTVVDGGPSTSGVSAIDYLAATFGGTNDNIQGALLLNERVGENAPLLGSTNGIADGVNTGVTNQWHFYGITNSAGFTNAVFVTFLPATLSLPRMGVDAATEQESTRLEADIDLYVSTDPGLLELDPTVINNSYQSRTRSGTESIVLTNAVEGVYYIGVKSEDHEAANYTLFTAFSLLPFSEEDEGGVTLRGVPVPAAIPDGSNVDPGAALVLGIAPRPIDIRRVIVTNEISHQNIGDLIGNLSHNTDFAVLNNHTFPLDDDTITNYTYIYEDLGEGDIFGSQTTEGPGSLRNFSGDEGVGVWLLTMVDDSQNLSNGVVENLVIRLERALDTNEFYRTVQPFSFAFEVIEVPVGATNLEVCVSVISENPLPVELFIRRGDFPDFELFDRHTTILPPGDCESISTADVPPLQPGNYFIGVYNPNARAQDVRITVRIDLGVDGRDQGSFPVFGKEQVTDDAVSYARQFVGDDRRIAALEVGLVVEHPRVSDLVTHLISPKGKRILLVENRGGADDTGYGGGKLYTNAVSADAGDESASTNIISVGANVGTLTVTYNFYSIPDQMRVYYDDQLIKDTGLVNGTNVTFSVQFGPGLDTDLVIIVNEGGNTNPLTAWDYTATVVGSTLSYLVLTEDTEKTTTPIKFAIPPLGGLNVSATGTVVFADGFEVAPTNYPASSNIGPWLVVTNDVDVFTAGYQGVAAPPEGTNFLDINGIGSTGTNATADGTIQITNLALMPGRNYQLSFAYTRSPDSVTNGVFPVAEVRLGAEVFPAVAPMDTNGWTNLVWHTNRIAFTATEPNPVLEVKSLTPGTNGVLFDQVEIVEAPQQDRFYHPETSLDVVVGDSAEGFWTLEFWDNRAGASIGPPKVVSWELRFIYETEVPTPIALVHGIPSTNAIPPDECLYYAVDVPFWALFATNELISATDPVNVWFNQRSLPDTTVTNAGDFLLLDTVTVGTNTLSTNGTPPLDPGSRYFLCVENTSTGQVTVVFQVEFNVTALTEGVPLTNTLSTNRFGGFTRMFSYDVSTNDPTALAFDLFDLSGPMDLVARFERLPQLQFDYGSFNPGTNDENITIFPDSTPVPLTQGRWYLAVRLAAFQPADYTILATEFTNDLSGIITLTNAIPYFNSNNGVNPIEDFYRFTAVAPVERLQFEILGPTADMTLLVRKGLPLPSLANFHYLGANPGTNDEFILVLPDSSPVIASPGEWFLTALNLSGMPADYAIKATQFAETGRPITVMDPILQSNLFCFSWNSLIGARYVVQGRTTLFDPGWVNRSGTITATDVVTAYCEPLPSPYHFFRVIDGVAVDPGSEAQIAIRNVSVGPGEVTLEWLAPPTYEFEVQYSDVMPPVWTAFPGPPLTSTDGTFTFIDDGGRPGLPPIRYYRIVLLP